MELSDLKTNILNYISKNEEAHFKNQQLGEPDLTEDEKRVIAEDLFNRSPSLFLAKFGKYLLEEHLSYFVNNDDYEVNFYLDQIMQEKNKPVSKQQVRNRRLEALRRLKSEGDYFSDIEMKRRNPLLFEELVGQYLTEKEKKEHESTNPSVTSFSEFFLDLVERDCSVSKLKKEIENDVSTLGCSRTPDDSMEAWAVAQSSGPLWGEHYHSTSNTQRVLRNSRTKGVTAHEKVLLLNEFRSHVYSDFLVGKDVEFDYSSVDMNTDYDDLSMIESDQQDSYFDSESPRTVMDDDSD